MKCQSKTRVELGAIFAHAPFPNGWVKKRKSVSFWWVGISLFASTLHNGIEGGWSMTTSSARLLQDMPHTSSPLSLLTFDSENIYKSSLIKSSNDIQFSKLWNQHLIKPHYGIRIWNYTSVTSYEVHYILGSPNTKGYGDDLEFFLLSHKKRDFFWGGGRLWLMLPVLALHALIPGLYDHLLLTFLSFHDWKINLHIYITPTLLFQIP